jgi:succinyl-CoA synthetase beta subunit
MNLHEYQAKELLASFGVLTQRGVVANSIEEATKAAQALTEKTGTTYWMVKAQIHAGGRGKGGGVKLAKSMEEVKNHAENILGMMLKTPQTAAEGKKVYQVLIAEDVYYPGEEEPKEYYISILLNRESGKNMFVYSTEGGMDIEQVAEKTPELILRIRSDPLGKDFRFVSTER